MPTDSLKPVADAVTPATAAKQTPEEALQKTASEANLDSTSATLGSAKVLARCKSPVSLQKLRRHPRATPDPTSVLIQFLAGLYKG